MLFTIPWKLPIEKAYEIQANAIALYTRTESLEGKLKVTKSC